MDCPICLESFNLSEFTPRVFPCGHGICSACIDLLLIQGKKSAGRGNQHIKIECPQCKRPFIFTNEIEAKSQIGKNFALIAFLEAKIELDQKEEQRKLQEKEEHKRLLKLQEEQIRKQLQSEQEKNKSLFDKFRASYLQKSKHFSASEAQYNGLLQLQEQKNFIENEIMIFESEKDMMNTELKKYDALKKPIIEEFEQAKAHIEKGKEALKMKNLEFYFYPECVLNRGEEGIIDQLERGEVNMLQAVEKLKMIEEEAEKIIAQVNKIQMMLDDLEQQGLSVDTKIREEKAKIERINSQREQDEYQRIMKVTERQTQLIEVKSVFEESKGAGDNIAPFQESQIVSGVAAIKSKLQLCEEQDQVEFIVKGHDCMLFAAAGCQNSNQTQTYYVMVLDKADYQIYIYQNGYSNQLHSQD